MRTVWLERFLLGGVCVGVFVSFVMLNVLKFDWTQRATLGGAILLFSYFVGHTIEKQRALATSSSQVAAPLPLPSETYKPDASQQTPPQSTVPPKHHTVSSDAEAHPPSPLRPLSSFSDGQRFVLKQKLEAHAGSSVRLVLVGNDPQAGIVFDQLVDIFNDAGWKIRRTRIGMIGIVGMNFPNAPYLTSANIASPIVADVYSIFASAGIALPLTPNAFMGSDSGSTPPDVVIVVKEKSL
jgi:hypothetical protein